MFISSVYGLNKYRYCVCLCRAGSQCALAGGESPSFTDTEQYYPTTYTVHTTTDQF